MGLQFFSSKICLQFHFTQWRIACALRRVDADLFGCTLLVVFGRAWLSLAYGVVISAFMGWVVWGWINQVRGVARSAPLSYLMAPVAGLVSWLSGGEVFNPIKIGGAMLALAGVAFAQFAAHDRRVEGTPGE